jgi:hypothetical protein
MPWRCGGPYGPNQYDDANNYSRVGDVAGVSVYYWDGSSSSPYLLRTHIHGALTEVGFTGQEDAVDLDALMVWDVSQRGYWSTGDMIIFSIRMAPNFDGGEIIVKPFGGPAYFLSHGGHLWDTAFDVTGTFGVAGEEVDAIEAFRAPPGIGEGVGVPTLTQWGLIILLALLSAGTVLLLLRRRQSMVQA